MLRFNTQPPESGCQYGSVHFGGQNGFNTQPPEGGCIGPVGGWQKEPVSTHSRPKAAAYKSASKHIKFKVSTHGRPKAAAL